jgi:hypothetical protein
MARTALGIGLDAEISYPLAILLADLGTIAISIPRLGGISYEMWQMLQRAMATGESR